MISNKIQPETVSDYQNGGIKVREYIAPYGSHGDHEDLLSLIDGVWLTETDWQKLAQEKLQMDRSTFHWMKEELEDVGCVSEFAGLYSAILTQIPVPPFKFQEEFFPDTNS
jgi:hypothetical protein